jgi:hypothetical protein
MTPTEVMLVKTTQIGVVLEMTPVEVVFYFIFIFIFFINDSGWSLGGHARDISLYLKLSL